MNRHSLSKGKKLQKMLHSLVPRWRTVKEMLKGWIWWRAETRRPPNFLCVLAIRVYYYETVFSGASVSSQWICETFEVVGCVWQFRYQADWGSRQYARALCQCYRKPGRYNCYHFTICIQTSYSAGVRCELHTQASKKYVTSVTNTVHSIRCKIILCQISIVDN